MSEDIDKLCPTLACSVAALADGSCTPTELLSTCIERCRAENPHINAFITIDEAGAYAAALAADERQARNARRSLFDGIPIGVKDNIDVKGMPTSNGIAKRHPATEDAACIAKLRDAGVVMLGKLNMHEAALGTTTENPHFGATLNPRNTDYSPGGSSGGSGAAVAAGMVPLALGTDTMGSVRLPAASCGVVGWKPTHGLVSNHGVCELHASLDAVGPIVREVADLPLAMECFSVHAAPASAGRQFSVAVLAENDSSAMDDEIARWWRNVIARVSPTTVSVPGYVPTLTRRAALLDIEANIARSWPSSMRALASNDLKQMLSFGENVTDDRRQAAVAAIADTKLLVNALLDSVDAVVSPASPVPPTRLGAELVASQADYLLLANIAGVAAVTVPAGVAADGMPVGLHIMTRAGNDAMLPAIVASVCAQLQD